MHDFETILRSQFEGTGFLSDSFFNSPAISSPLGDRKQTTNLTDLDKLTAYVVSLDTIPLSPYRNSLNGSLTDNGIEGQQIFESLDCQNCHSGTHLTDSLFDLSHNVGTINDGSGNRLSKELIGFDTANTSRNLEYSPPYLHDGSALTLYDVINNTRHGNAHVLSSI